MEPKLQILDPSDFSRKCKPVLDGFMRELKEETSLAEKDDSTLVMPKTFTFSGVELPQPWLGSASHSWSFLLLRLTARKTIEVRTKLKNCLDEYVKLLKDAERIGGLRVAVIADPDRFEFELRFVLPYQ